MILGIDEIHRRIREERLLEYLSERELNNPEGAGIDLRIGKVFRLEGGAFLGINERETPKGILVAEYDPNKQSSIILNPGDYFLTESIERFNTPLDLLAIIKPRTTLHRSGIITRVSVVDPGYSGTIHPAIYNAGPVKVQIELGARYVNAMFFEIKGKTHRYRGQWQGGRVHTDGREKQV
ncbi:MAG: hypothetical protein HY456_00255 [Parcubacteria group bacterium]|nr:hypothetical protein [Parcubacteria group bacterium]